MVGRVHVARPFLERVIGEQVRQTQNVIAIVAAFALPDGGERLERTHAQLEIVDRLPYVRP